MNKHPDCAKTCQYAKEAGAEPHQCSGVCRWWEFCDGPDHIAQPLPPTGTQSGDTGELKPKDARICPTCNERMDLVCDQTGSNDFYHCFKCSGVSELAQLRAENAELRTLVGEMFANFTAVDGKLGSNSEEWDDMDISSIASFLDGMQSYKVRADALLSGQPAPSPWRPMSEAPTGVRVIHHNGKDVEIGRLLKDPRGPWSNVLGCHPKGWMPLPPVAEKEEA